jgi:hypothetical protein
MSCDPWPFPSDDRFQRQRRIVGVYRSALARVDPETCAGIDGEMTRLGQGWVAPIASDVLDLDELLSPEKLAGLIFVDARTIRMWGYRGHIENRGSRRKPLYRYRDVIAYCARRRK